MKYLTAILILASSPCWGVYAYVQSRACASSPATSNTCQYTAPVATTDLLVVACMSNKLNACLTVTDDQGDTFTLVNGTTTTGAASGGTLIWGIWYATATASSLTVVTCADACANGTWVQQSIHEYSGNMYLSDPFDAFTSSSSAVSVATTTILAPPITPAKSGSLIFAIAPQMPSAALAGNGSIRTNTVDNSYWATEDYIQGAVAVYQSSFTVTSASQVNKISQASFRPPTPPARGVEIWQ